MQDFFEKVLTTHSNHPSTGSLQSAYIGEHQIEEDTHGSFINQLISILMLYMH